MIATQTALIRRELWEHRSLFVVPLVIAVVESLGFIVAQVTATTFGGNHAIDLAVLGASSLGDVERSAAINVLMLGVSSLFVMAMGIVALFYCLDVLYAERKDKSILFWRSLPVTDAETVLSKLITAVVALPVITLGAIAVTHLVVLLISSFWIGGRGANAWQLLWTSAPFVDNWMSTLVYMIALTIWSLPFIGWFLFVSAYTKRSPLLMALLPLIVVPMLQRIFLGSWSFGSMILGRLPFSAPIISMPDGSSEMFDSEEEVLELAQSGASLFSILDIGGFLSNPSVWLGAIVGGAFIVGAIYVRRYRADI